MSVPTHNLYDFVHQVLEKKFWIKYFSPWGTRHIEHIINYYYSNDIIDISETNDICKKIFPDNLCDYDYYDQFQSLLLCHDQEPLNFDLHECKNNQIHPNVGKEKYKTYYIPKNLNLRYSKPNNYQKFWILLHSELNSEEVEKYENTGKYVCAYWWSHALISLDWFRYAKYDLSVKYNLNNKKIFLIYCRDCTGSRLYRQTFINSLAVVSNTCQIGSFDNLNVTSDSSATYNVNDFNNTNISVVLETVVDRIHLTEKILRPIALGHPFILLAGTGSLKLLKKYGFKTFSPWINESYDNEPNLDKRIKLIIDEMTRISNLDKSSQLKIFTECVKIAQFNKQMFFSEDFLNFIVDELKQNVNFAAEKTANQIDWECMWKNRLHRKKNYPEIFKGEMYQKQKPYIILLIRHLKKGGTLENYVPPDSD